MRTGTNDTFYQPKDTKDQPKGRYLLMVEYDFYVVDGWQAKGDHLIEFWTLPRQEVVVLPVHAEYRVVRMDYLESTTVGEKLKENSQSLTSALGLGALMVEQPVPMAKKVRAN